MQLNLTPAKIRNIALACAAAVLTIAYWPVHTVPTGSRGVITVGGAIRGIEQEGFLLVAPWQKLNNFNIRAAPVPFLNLGK